MLCACGHRVAIAAVLMRVWMGRKWRVNGDTAGMRVVPRPFLPASGEPNADPGTAKATAWCAYHHGFCRMLIWLSEDLGIVLTCCRTFDCKIYEVFKKIDDLDLNCWDFFKFLFGLSSSNWQILPPVSRSCSSFRQWPISWWMLFVFISLELLESFPPL